AVPKPLPRPLPASGRGGKPVFLPSPLRGGAGGGVLTWRRRSRIVILALSALSGAVIVAPGARAANIPRGGQPAELTVTSGGAHSVRVTLKPLGMALPPSPSLLTVEIQNPAISLRTFEAPVQARVGTLDVVITPSPLTVLVKGAAGREIQKLVFD